MFRIVDGNSRGLADVGKFIDLINDPPPELHDPFDPGADIYISRAPGRLDVMGGIADYSGSLVLQMPIAEATIAAVQACDESSVRIVSLSPDRKRHRMFEMDVSDLASGGENVDYATIRGFFASDTSSHWVSYAAGVFYVLSRELGIKFSRGARILISSTIPTGKGVSSSAALEVAVMNAVCAAFDIRVDPRELALLCQKVENRIVGASCGIMDQMSSNCGVEDSLVSILCQPAEIRGEVKIPESIEFWGIDSGVRHAVVGSDYSSVRIAAFMGYRIIAELAGLMAERVREGLVKIDDSRWGGYLCNVTPAEYEREFSSRIPTEMRGADFIEHYGGTTDSVTKIDPNHVYQVKTSAGHAIYENFRVNRFSELLAGDLGEVRADDLGKLMFASHAGYAACGLNESGTDRLVELVREKRANGLLGARITGGGSGGTVAILARSGSSEIISRVAEQYRSETGRKPYIFHGSSPGGSTFGRLRLSGFQPEPAIGA